MKIMDINFIQKKSGCRITMHLLLQLRYRESRVSSLSFCQILYILCPPDMVVHIEMLAASSIWADLEVLALSSELSFEEYSGKSQYYLELF